MRSISAAQAKILEKKNRSVFVRVQIDRGSSDWVDMTTLQGRNWVLNATINESVDKRVGTATVSLMREVYQLNLSPFDDDSRLNASGTITDLNNPIKIQTALLPQDATPAESDYMDVFEGRIDSVNWAGEAIKLNCSDKMGVLVSTYIESVEEYGAALPTGASIESVIQSILDANINTATGIPPYSSASPLKVYTENGTALDPTPAGDLAGFAVGKFDQSQQTTMAAIQALAISIGYELRWSWHNNTDQFQLYFRTIDRNKNTPDQTFDSGEYYNLQELQIQTRDVRNVVRVIWFEPAEDQAAGESVRKEKERTDAASVTKYGRRFMQLGESSASFINSESEATTFADHALADLAEPIASLGCDMPYFPFVQIHDYYKFLAQDESRFSSDQSLAVVSFTHTFTATEAKTSVKLRGKPSGGAKRWIGIESRPGNPVSSPTESAATPPSATSVTAKPSIGGITVAWADPLKTSPSPSAWKTSEVHVSAASGFTPSDSTLKATGRVEAVSITDLDPGVTKYVKVLHRDRFGQISDPGSASEVSTTTQTVGPYHMNPDWRLARELQNGNFGISTLNRATYPPDYWTIDSGTYGVADEFYFKDTSAATLCGGQSFWSRSNAASTRSFFSEKFPINQLEQYICKLRFMVDSSPGAVAGNNLTVTVRWYDSNKGLISTDNGVGESIGGGPTHQISLNTSTDEWIEKTTLPALSGTMLIPPSTARFASTVITLNCTGGAQNIYIGSIKIEPAPVACTITDASGQWLTNKVWVDFEGDSIPSFGYNSGCFDTSTHVFTAPHSGLYRASFSGNVVNLSSGDFWFARLSRRADASSAYSNISPTSSSMASDGSDCRMNTAWHPLFLDQGNQVKLQLFNNDSVSAARNLYPGTHVFSVTEVTNGLI